MENVSKSQISDTKLLWDKEEYRPIPFYFLNCCDDAAISREAIRDAIDRLKTAGYGGCVLFNKPPTGFAVDEFLSEKWFRTIRCFVEEALKGKMAIWINDAFDYPPGEAGGQVHKIAPHLNQMRLSRNVDGSISIRDVGWGFPAFEEPESSKLFIEFVYEAYKRSLGDLFGNGIVGFFSDADNRRMPYGFLRETYFPWSHSFAANFKKEFGYSIESHLRDVLDGKDCQETVDYWRYAGRIYQQWFANNHAWCRANHLKYTFHTSDSGPRALDETLRSSTFCEGDAFELFAHSDYPGTDHELRSLNGGTTFFPWIIENARWGEANENCRTPTFSKTFGDVRAKIAASAAFLNNNTRCMCECFPATNWSCEPDELRRIAVWQIMQGINFLVPHAAHHRVFGATKYFAPPELLRYGVLAKSMRMLNDHLAELCAIASCGELHAPVAVLDPTEEIWRSGKACPRFFELCAELNRLPYGYVIAPPSALIGNQKRFLVAVNPGIRLSPDVRSRIAKSGTILINEDELGRLASLVHVDCSYTGSGKPHFMRRKVDRGELLLIANIEDEGEITGSLKYDGGTHSIALLPGEVAIFAPDISKYRSPAGIRHTIPLARTACVEWKIRNSVTMFRWEDASGQAKSIASNFKELFFRWSNSEELPPLRLQVPAAAVASYSFDGVNLDSGAKRMIFDDEYLEFDMKGSGSAGRHVIKLTKHEPLSVQTPFYLKGDFDVDVVKGSNGIFIPALKYFNFSLEMPQFAEVFLKNRRNELDTGRSWADQGQLFYSGEATYVFEFTIPADFKHPVLKLERVSCRIRVTVNGIEVGCRIFPPYEFDLDGFSGKCRAELNVENTLGNMLEGYGTPSGLMSIPELIDVETEQ